MAGCKINLGRAVLARLRPMSWDTGCKPSLLPMATLEADGPSVQCWLPRPSSPSWSLGLARTSQGLTSHKGNLQLTGWLVEYAVSFSNLAGYPANEETIKQPLLSPSS